METASTQTFEALKTRLKATWEAGDFSEIATHIGTAGEEFIDRLNLSPGMKVLDAACGSGNLAIPAARTGANVTGLDLAENLVESARKRAAAEGLTITVEQGDVEALPYDDNTFDVVMSMFGAMFAPRPEVTAGELIRVCKPGGRVAMANWTPEGFAGQMFKLSGKYLPPPPMPPPVLWGAEDSVRDRFGAAVSDLKMTRILADMVFEFPPAAVVEHFKTFFGPTVMAFKALDPSLHDDLSRDLEALWAANNIATDGTTHVKGEFLEVIATKK